MRISVIVPSYEAGPLLLEALTSLQTQIGFGMGADVEAIVADDGSKGAASARAMATAATLPGVVVVPTKGRTGPSAARNLAARHATGDWLAFLDADDLFAPDALTLRWHTAQEHPGLGCVVTDYAEFPADAPFDPQGLRGVIASTPSRRTAVQDALDTGRTLILDRPVRAFLLTIPMWTGSVLLRRDVFEALGGFPEGHHIGEDLHLWLRIAATQRLAFVPRVTAYCRKGHASLTAGEPAMNLKTTRCFQDLLTDPLMQGVSAQLRDMVAQGYRSESYYSRARGDRRQAFLHAIEAFRLQPARLASWRALACAPMPVRDRTISAPS
jgi:glycosyltransferase involved in cell wall biosynthesis